MRSTSAANEIIRPFLPVKSYYGVNWRDGRPKTPDAYPNKANIPERVAPLGFVLAFGLAGSPLDRQAEIDYLVQTQDKDIAPEWQELRENKFYAESIDQLHDHQIDLDEQAGVPASDIYGCAPDGTAAFDPPTRAEQALMEWEKSSWIAGPVVRAHWDVTERNTLTLVLDSVKHQAGPYITHKLNPEQKRALITALIDDAAREGTIPTVDEVLEAQHNYARRQKFGIPRDRGTPTIESEWDLDDPYRYALHAEPDTDDRRPDTTYAGPDTLGMDDELTAIHWQPVMDANGRITELLESPD